jgi:pimeloyl-ACP methyl ester carboxylesterase
MAKTEASFWSRGPGIALIFLMVVVGGTASGAIAVIYALTHPARDTRVLDPADLNVRTEDVPFEAADGVPLSGWFVSGRPGNPVIVLCHDLGGARSSLLNSAVALNRSGFPLFLFDFRGHGESGGKGSTLGLDERLDILGAVEYLKTRKDVKTDRFGAWGVGMGAYAAALAAVENKEISALALDSLYPDVTTQLDRMVRERIPPALEPLVRLIRLFYEPYFAFKLKRFSVAGSIGDLAGRNLLFIAGSDVPERFQEEQALYASIPEVPSGDKNFLEMKASGISGLYGEDKKKYDQGLVGFFAAYLSGNARSRSTPSKPIQVIEKN